MSTAATEMSATTIMKMTTILFTITQKSEFPRRENNQKRKGASFPKAPPLTLFVIAFAIASLDWAIS
jgi:hypothetical protein